MSASFLSVLRSGPPPPKVALLPDALFFFRALPVTAGATVAEATAQVELGLEALSPFPLAQLYYGWYWQPGAEKAFVFAAYRRRFTAEQTAEWANAEVVLPAAAASFGAKVEPATTVILPSTEGLTAVHWESPGVPSQVRCAVLEPEATEEQRAQARESLIASFGGTKQVIDLPGDPIAEPALTDREIVFRSGELESRFPETVVTSADVRDKADLAALRGARKRDIMLWRVALGCVAAFALFALSEAALLGARQWNGIRQAKIRAQQPTVASIEASQQLVELVNELTTQRLLPLEMITAMVGKDGERRPADIAFTRAVGNLEQGVNTIVVELQTSNPAQANAYENQLRSFPEIESVRSTLMNAVGGRSNYQFRVTFKPGVLKALPPQ